MSVWQEDSIVYSDIHEQTRGIEEGFAGTDMLVESGLDPADARLHRLATAIYNREEKSVECSMRDLLR